LIGFAAETHDVLDHAREKLQRKRVDLIVANDVAKPGVGFEADTNAVTFVSRDGIEEVPAQSKTAVADRILDRIERMLASAAAPVPGR
jgi:phosphopantothenoylcysteine decarboxylase / phosphopantothenate---cysteine ligase